MKGICFIEPLFDLIPKEIKRQTRRVINPQPIGNYCLGMQADGRFKFACNTANQYEYIRPRYQIGDKVYLKEPYFDPTTIRICKESTYIYRYNPGRNTPFVELESGKVRWSNKLFMPARAARYWIEITNVKVEWLQDISYRDCEREGIRKNPWQMVIGCNSYTCFSNGIDNVDYISPDKAYQALINKIDGKGTWDDNPMVFVYDFKLTTKP